MLHNCSSNLFACTCSPQHMLPEASVYFCFTEDALDQAQHPNKLVLARSNPTVFDICSTIKSLFFPNQVCYDCAFLTLQDVTLTCSFAGVPGIPMTDYPEQSQNLAPVNDRNNVIFVSVKPRMYGTIFRAKRYRS